MSLLYERKSGWTGITEELKDTIFSFCEGYKTFLNNGKTERECVKAATIMAERAGFVPLHSITSLKCGDKVYAVNHGKNIMLSVIGNEALENGVSIIAAHIDSPRLDLKQNPLYEDMDLSLFKTHYYGGIKKYQWTAIPLSLHGVVVKADGTVIEITVGEDETDPIFTITDLLPHLADEQMKKKLHEGIAGEDLNILIGSLVSDTEKSKAKNAIMELINGKYGIVEEDFISAEIEMVPAFNARDLGFDRSMIASYGQDDRVCAYTSLAAILGASNLNKTAICFLADKEEVGSMGVTGMRGAFMENVLAEIMDKAEGFDNLKLRKCTMNSICLSADVGAGVDPTYKSVSEINNAPIIGCGITITKYTGSRGKGGSSDADAELVGRIRKLFNDNNIKWQIGELGKVDQGGGGTVAQYIANTGVDTIDVGVPLLSMHSPYEVSSKFDVYETFRGYKTFYER